MFPVIRRIIDRDASDRTPQLDTQRRARHCGRVTILQVITASTRPSRVGPHIADWFVRVARNLGNFDVEPIDLGAVGLPLFDESHHPRLRKYEHEHTKSWSATVTRADAYVFVTPEYNHMPAPSLVNAIDYLLHEWAYKPVGFVSYGGVSAGLRAVQALKPMLAGLKLVPMVESVAIPFFPNYLHADTGEFVADKLLEDAATAMLRELERWANALKPLRG
jgi:NAD(P)H-dependent FMN reductase